MSKSVLEGFLGGQQAFLRRGNGNFSWCPGVTSLGYDLRHVLEVLYLDLEVSGRYYSSHSSLNDTYYAPISCLSRNFQWSPSTFILGVEISTCTTAGAMLHRAAQWRGVCPPSSRALKSAPASSRAFTTSGVSLSAAAQWRGVDSRLSRALMRSARASRSAFTTSSVLCLRGAGKRVSPPLVIGGGSVGLLSATAQWRGVFPLLSRALGSAPASRSAFTTAGVFLSAAQWRGVFPLLSRAFGSAPALRRFTVLKSPPRAATCSEVMPSWSAASGLYMVFCVRVLPEAATSVLSCGPWSEGAAVGSGLQGLR